MNRISLFLLPEVANRSPRLGIARQKIYPSVFKANSIYPPKAPITGHPISGQIMEYSVRGSPVFALSHARYASMNTVKMTAPPPHQGVNVLLISSLE